MTTPRPPRVVQAAHRLQRAAAQARQQPDDDLAWLGACVEQLLAGEARSFELATGLAPGRGEYSWGTYRDAALRDAALRELRQQLQGSSTREAARRIHEALGRYLQGRMRAQRARRADDGDAWSAALHRALEANNREVPSVHTIRKAIATEPGSFDSHDLVLTLEHGLDHSTEHGTPAPDAAGPARLRAGRASAASPRR